MTLNERYEGLLVKYNQVIEELELAQQKEHRAHRSFKELVVESEDKQKQMLKQIQELLVANHIVHRRNEIIKGELESLLYPKTVDKQKVGQEVW